MLGRFNDLSGTTSQQQQGASAGLAEVSLAGELKELSCVCIDCAMIALLYLSFKFRWPQNYDALFESIRANEDLKLPNESVLDTCLNPNHATLCKDYH